MSQLHFTEKKKSGKSHVLILCYARLAGRSVAGLQVTGADYGATAGVAMAAPKVNGPAAVVSVSVVPLME
jgi:hypothetical protein